MIQRFGSAANPNIRLHCLVLDGMYRCGADGEPVFIEAGALSDGQIHAVLQTVITRRMKRLMRQGVLVQELGETWLAEIDIDGFSLHAAVRCEAHEHQRLEHLCRYLTRPALSDERLQLDAVGQVVPQGPAGEEPAHEEAVVEGRAAGGAGPADATSRRLSRIDGG